MTGNDNIPEWITPYWNRLYQELQGREKSQAVLETIIANRPGTISTSALAEQVETRLEEAGLLDDQAGYDHQHLNQVLPLFEQLGIIHRVPKFERDDQYIILPVEIMCDWLADCALDPMPPPTALSPDWATNQMGTYITESWKLSTDGGASTTEVLDNIVPDAETRSAGLSLPAEGLVFVGVTQYVEEPTPQDITIQMGSLDRLRDTEVLTLADELELGTSIPSADGPFVDDDGVHDYAIFGQVTNVTTLGDETAVERKLTQQMSTWLASAQELYARIHDDTADDDDVGPSLTATQLARAADAVKELEPVDAAMERFGQDVRIEKPTETSLGRIIFGTYRRNNP